MADASKIFAHTVELVIEAESAEVSLLKVEEIVRAVHESDALPEGVRVRSYGVATPEGESE